MKKYLPLLAALLLCQSCKKSNENRIDITPEVLATDHEISVAGPKFPSNGSTTQGDQNYNLLGYGYDVTGKYADTSAVRNPVININSYATDDPYRVVITRAFSTGFPIVNANDAEDLSTKLSSEIEETKGSNLFKGTITSAFTNQDAFSKKYIYARYSLIAQQLIIKISPYYTEHITDYLTPAFKQDIQVLGASDLVKKYGTHILSNISKGCRFNILYQGKVKNNDNRTEVVKTGFRFALKKVFGFSNFDLTAIEAKNFQSIESAKVVYDVQGGDPSKLKVLDFPQKTMVNISDWSNDLTEEKGVFIDINKKGLMPLHEFISDPVKKAAVKDYISSYLLKSQVKLIE